MMNIDQAKELQSSLMWAGVKEEIDRKIFFIAQRLLTCSPDELKDLQREVKVLEEMKRLPEDVITREE